MNTRQTRYCTALAAALSDFGHATNVQLLHELRQMYPVLSATTVHRATQRLAARGKIALAPAANDGSMRYDANLKAHDHFHCSRCDRLVDIDIKAKVVPMLEAAIDGCKIAGRLTIGGICKHCKKELEL